MASSLAFLLRAYRFGQSIESQAMAAKRGLLEHETQTSCRASCRETSACLRAASVCATADGCAAQSGQRPASSKTNVSFQLKL